MFAYEREHEREADRIGLELMARAGYQPIEASKVWAQLLEEIKAEQDWTGDAGSRSVLFASHPPAEERQQALVERAGQISSAKTETGEAAYRAALGPHRWGLLEDELKRRKSGETLALFQRMVKEAPKDGELHYFLGEAYRLRAAEGDRQLALDAYQAAAKQANAPAEVYRSMGMLYQQTGERDAAQKAFQRYLAVKPAAADAEMIQMYLKGGV
jgi:predicted Zn-dependent protease